MRDRDGVYWLGVLSAAFTYLFGATGNGPVHLAVELMALDVATGLVRGARWGRLSSSVAAVGLRKKLAMIGAMVLGHLADVHNGSGDTFKGYLANYVSMVELLSNLENLAGAGLTLPAGLQGALKGLFGPRAEGGVPTEGRRSDGKGSGAERG